MYDGKIIKNQFFYGILHATLSTMYFVVMADDGFFMRGLQNKWDFAKQKTVWQIGIE